MKEESVTVQCQVALVTVIHHERLMCTLNTWLPRHHNNVQTHLEILDVISCNDMLYKHQTKAGKFSCAVGHNCTFIVSSTN